MLLDAKTIPPSARHWLASRIEEGQRDAIDLYLAEFLASAETGYPQEIFWLTVLLAIQASRGHVCLKRSELSSLCQQWGVPFSFDEIESWRHWQGNVLGAADQQLHLNQKTPLVFDGEYLYFRHYYLCEQKIARHAIQSQQTQGSFDAEKIQGWLQVLFGSPVAEKEIDWQQLAVANAAVSRFAVITGGPGTGKTWTITRMLALLLNMTASGEPVFADADMGGALPRIRLAAPTGKAAIRMTESMHDALGDLPLSDELKAALPSQALTIHRLLGMGKDGIPRWNRARPLPADVVVIDEASMVDLEMMSYLVDALAPHTHLYLVGDRNQLSSVEAGSVFADLCGSSKACFSQQRLELLQQCGFDSLDNSFLAKSGGLQNHLVQLQKTYRFSGESGINQLAEWVRDPVTNPLSEAFSLSSPEDLTFQSVVQEKFIKLACNYYQPLMNLVERFSADHYPSESLVQELVQSLGQFRVLCANRKGPWGTESINKLLDQELATSSSRWQVKNGNWFCGRIVMLTANDWSRKLFNGDVGIVLPDPESGQLKAAFPRLHTENEVTQGQPWLEHFRWVSLSQLGNSEPAWSMTIHKSQGSEFDRVALVMPTENSPLLTRELLYTGITRCKRELDIIASWDVLQRAVGNPAHRASGLAWRMNKLSQ